LSFFERRIKMKAEEHKKIIDELRELISLINSNLLETPFALELDFYKFQKMLEIPEIEAGHKNLPLLINYYDKLGWDMEIETKCIDYHDNRYVSEIYLRYKKEK